MEDTLLVGDHLLVDKLAYAPAGPVSKYFLPYTPVEARRHYRVPLSGRYPADLRQALHGRSRRPHPDRQQTGLPERLKLTSRTRSTRPITSTPIATISRASRMSTVVSGRHRHAGASRGQRRSGGAAGILFRDGRQSRFVARQPLLGICAARKYHRQAADHLLVLRRADRPAEQFVDRASTHMLDLAKNFFSKTRWQRTFMLLHGYPVP